MNRPYSAHSPYSTTPTERLDADRVDVLDDPGHEDYEDYDAYEFAGYDDDQLDRRWIWVAVVAGAILFVAVICTGVILGGGDSGSVSATVSAPATNTSQPATTTAPATAPATTSAAAPPAATSLPPAATSLPPETVTTVTPVPTAGAAPSPVPTPQAPEPQAPGPQAAPIPRTITYTVTGNRAALDLVTVIYTDQQGGLQSAVNVALPWTKTVVLDPGVELSSVTATSLGGQLNCWITDASGTPLVSQTNNSMIATCTK